MLQDSKIEEALPKFVTEALSYMNFGLSELFFGCYQIFIILPGKNHNHHRPIGLSRYLTEVGRRRFLWVQPLSEEQTGVASKKGISLLTEVGQ